MSIGNQMKYWSFLNLISNFCFYNHFFEEKYQAFDTVFHHQMKLLEVRQKYSASRASYFLHSSRCFIW